MTVGRASVGAGWGVAGTVRNGVLPTGTWGILTKAGPIVIFRRLYIHSSVGSLHIKTPTGWRCRVLAAPLLIFFVRRYHCNAGLRYSGVAS